MPEDRGQLKTHETVEDASRLLGIDEIHVDASWGLYGIENGVLRNLVENDTWGIGLIEFEHLSEMPGYGLTLAVFIGSEPDLLGLLGELLELLDLSLLLVGDDVDRVEIVLDIDAEIIFLEVSDVPFA